MLDPQLQRDKIPYFNSTGPLDPFHSPCETEFETKGTLLLEELMLPPQAQPARSPCHVLVEDLHARHRSRWHPVLATEPVRARPHFRDAFDEKLDAASFPLLCGLCCTNMWCSRNCEARRKRGLGGLGLVVWLGSTLSAVSGNGVAGTGWVRKSWRKKTVVPLRVSVGTTGRSP